MTIADILEEHGPSLSSELVRQLVSNGLREDAARQRLKRAKEPVLRLPLSLPHNQRFFYLKEQFQSSEYWEALWKALSATGSAYGHACAAIEARGGIVPLSEFPSICGSPHALRGRLSASRVLHELTEVVPILLESEIPNVGRCIRFAPTVPTRVISNQEFHAQRTAEVVLLGALRGWLRRNSLVSYDKARVRGDSPEPEFMHFGWALSGPSYLAPLSTATKSGDKPGFVVADVALGREVSTRGVQAFINKALIARAQKGARPFLAMFVADRVSHEALIEARQARVLCTSVEEFLGEAVAKMLRELIATISDVAIAARDPDELARLLDSLSRIEGAVNNVRGAFFELITAHCVARVQGLTVSLGELAYDSTRRTDVDVLAQREGQYALAIECKAYKTDSEVDGLVVSEWLSQTVPTIRNWLREKSRLPISEMEFSFWTTSRFSAEALDILTKAKARTKAYNVSWRDGEAVLEYAARLKGETITKMLREHIYEHPVVGHRKSKKTTRSQDTSSSL